MSWKFSESFLRVESYASNCLLSYRGSCIYRMVGLSFGEKHFIQGGISQDLRSDGRKRLTYRPIYLETGVIPQVKNIYEGLCFEAWYLPWDLISLMQPFGLFVPCDLILYWISVQANGSARIRMGATDVIASVKVFRGLNAKSIHSCTLIGEFYLSYLFLLFPFIEPILAPLEFYLIESCCLVILLIAGWTWKTKPIKPRQGKGYYKCWL